MGKKERGKKKWGRGNNKEENKEIREVKGRK